MTGVNTWVYTCMHSNLQQVPTDSGESLIGFTDTCWHPECEIHIHLYVFFHLTSSVLPVINNISCIACIIA